jgi:arylsulfatase A-like enzyme
VIRPRMFFVALGEPDTYAHRRTYDSYLESIQRCDRFVREIWEKLQSMEEYRDTTTLIVTTDHGRGRTPADWPTHNKKTPGAEETWLAVMGPDTPASGERRDEPPILSAQIAATIAALLGENFVESDSRVNLPISGIISR